MANNLLVDPLYLDSAGSGIGAERLHIIKSVEWVNPLTPGDRAYLLDKNGAVICSFVCIVAGKGDSKWFGNKGQGFDGPLTLSILDSGALLLLRV